MAWWRPFGRRPAMPNTVVEGQTEQVSTAGGKYISEAGGNNAPPTYQDASGAPVEDKSPLGYSVGPVTITLLNITMMIGAGIYSTRECDITTHIQTHQLIWQSIIYPVRYGLGRRQSHLLDPRLLGVSPRDRNAASTDHICFAPAMPHVWSCVP